MCPADSNLLSLGQRGCPGGHQPPCGCHLVKAARTYSPVMVPPHILPAGTGLAPQAGGGVSVSVTTGGFTCQIMNLCKLVPHLPEAPAPAEHCFPYHCSRKDTNHPEWPTALSLEPPLALTAMSLFVTRWHGRAALLVVGGGLLGHGSLSVSHVLEGLWACICHCCSGITSALS